MATTPLEWPAGAAILFRFGEPFVSKGRLVTPTVVGSIGAAGLVVMAWASAYSARPVEAPPGTYEWELSAFAKSLERSGNLSGLEILW
jgi:hypothetical protein